MSSDPILSSPNMPTSSRNWQVLIGLILSLGSLYLAFQGVPLSQILDVIPDLLLGYIALAWVASVATLLAKAVRWKLFFSQRPPTFHRSFAIQTIGMFVNSFAPARLGDLLRAYLLGEENDHSKVFVLGTIVVEKIFDMVFLVISMALLLPQVVFPNWVSQPSEVTAILLVLVVLIITLIAWKKEQTLTLIDRIDRRLPTRWNGWILRQLKNLLSSLECIRNFRQLAGIILWSAIIWALGFLTNILVFWGMHLPLSFLPAIFLLVVLQVGVAVPSSPGRIGVFHYLTVLALSVFAIEKGPALSCGIILHIIVYLPLTLLGAFFIWDEKMSWGKIVNFILPNSTRKKS
jgi:uncharacterized protein (TIRG00374 family)